MTGIVLLASKVTFLIAEKCENPGSCSQEAGNPVLHTTKNCILVTSNISDL